MTKQNKIPDVILQDYLKFIEFVLLKKIILLGNTEVINDEVKNYFYKDLVFKKENGEIDKIIPKKERVFGLTELIKTYNSYVINDEEVIMYGSFYDVLLADMVDKFYINRKVANIDDKNINDNLTLLTNILEINQKYENINYKKTPLLSADVQMIGTIFSKIIKKLSKNKEISQERLLLISKTLSLSIRKELFKDNKKPIGIDYLSFDLNYYDEIAHFFTKHNNLLTSFFEKILKEIFLYLRNPDTAYYSEKELEQIKKTELKFNVLLNLEDQEIYSKDIEDITNFIKTKNKTKNKIKKNIFGQDNIIDTIVDKYLPKIYLNLNNRPLSFLFLGNSGTGKTEMGKQLAEILNTKHLLIPLGNFNDKHTQQTLLGAPPSYIGYGTPTILEKYVSEMKSEKKMPIIIFDEIEKGSGEFQNIFLELLDEGKMTLLNGKVLDLNKSIIIITSNLGVKREESIGFNMNTKEEEVEIERSEIESAVKGFLKKEIYNRITDTFVFNNLDKKNIEYIIKSKVRKSIERVKKNEVIKTLLINSGGLDEAEILKELKRKVKLDDIENIRKIESETENIIANKIEDYVLK